MERLGLFVIASVVVLGTVFTLEKAILPGQVAYAQPQDAWLLVSIPPLADIQLKDGSSITGRVKSLTATNMSVEFGGTSAVVPLETVSKIKFRSDKPVVQGSSTLAIRGGALLSNTTGARVWQNVPRNGFRFKDQSKGLAEVNLTTVLKPSEFRGVKAVAQTSPYLIDEISFTTNQIMNVRAVPTAP
ncbi:MAG: hypothetical protein H7Y37_11835 [Anaerolineae bacterium]|nr:hypothetical protein [Gloeobacterales cyanobacterium ES-bin-313]